MGDWTEHPASPAPSASRDRVQKIRERPVARPLAGGSAEARTRRRSSRYVSTAVVSFGLVPPSCPLSPSTARHTSPAAEAAEASSRAGSLQCGDRYPPPEQLPGGSESGRARPHHHHVDLRRGAAVRKERKRRESGSAGDETVSGQIVSPDHRLCSSPPGRACRDRPPASGTEPREPAHGVHPPLTERTTRREGPVPGT